MRIQICLSGGEIVKIVFPNLQL
ncbi:hypothetical protein KUF71_006255 [Frankliniella fusca]|uniref:Uncharacterized protein n=1 Tax=Frankliniella fusca TaxID=407009 RepID=A0AAE1H832_9NEOP|nr:hypothetical protein KUF71_006255 [Frankliniella fusca]